MELSNDEKVKRDLAYAEYVKITHELYAEKELHIKTLSIIYWKEMKKAHDIYMKKRGIIV